MSSPRLIDESTNLRYVIYIVISFLTNLGITVLLHEAFGLSTNVSFAIALVVVSLLNFAVLRNFVYRATHGKVDAQFVWYIASVVGFRTAEWLAFVGIHTLLGCPYRLGVLIVMATSTVIKNVVYRRLIFHVRGVGNRE